MSKLYKSIFLLLFWLLYFSIYYVPEFFDIKEFFTVDLWVSNIVFSIITAFVWFILVLWLLWFLNKLLENYIKKRFEKHKSAIFMTDLVIRFVNISKYILAFYVFSNFAILPNEIDFIANKTYSISLIIILIFFTTSLVNHFFTNELIEKTKLKALWKTLLPFVNKIIVIFIRVIWVITIVDNLWYDISALVAWAWIWGLAIAFAAQKSISNVFGAITILLNKPFKIWDYVNVNWITWTVKDIWLSYLTITDRAGHQVMIPNEAIISTNVENFSVRKNRRTDFTIGLIYWTTLEKMQKAVWIIEEIMKVYEEDETISSFRVNFNMFNAFSLDIQVTYFSLLNNSYNDFLKQKEEINLEIKKRFKVAEIEMAFPTQELILKK